MFDILKLTDDERRTIFRNTAQRMGVHEAIIEKDYWVCLTLDYLFCNSRYKNKLSFKGGTSLSKCFGLIQRFSEDIDLILDWRLLGYDKNEPWIERTKTKQDTFNKQANERAGVFLAEEFIPTFISEFSKMIFNTVNAEIDATDPLTINFHYPRIFRTESILQTIRLETGILAAWTPSIIKTVTPYIYDYYPKLSKTVITTVTASSAERTFWEKVTILHHEANRPEHLEMPIRYSRHYYDLYCIAKSDYKANALKQIDLLNRVTNFKIKFYPRAWAKYEEAMPGSIKLVPPLFRFEMLRNDYFNMREMLFGNYPIFDDLLECIRNLETEINSL